ncbi:MAG TPA: hypothetical protein VK138_15155 [Acidiferrobacterales bacterium]|nr:hypothetical protein [Acidiferrobacterales bacterium]
MKCKNQAAPVRAGRNPQYLDLSPVPGINTAKVKLYDQCPAMDRAPVYGSLDDERRQEIGPERFAASILSRVGANTENDRNQRW